MQSCDLVMAISALACSLAKDCSEEELNLWASFFSQLGDSLATIAACQAAYPGKKDFSCSSKEKTSG